MTYEKLGKYSKKLEQFVKICYHNHRQKLEELESEKMLNDEICKLRNKLNNSIVKGEDYDKIYKISVELDELISEYYIIEKIQKKRNLQNEKGKLTILA